MITLADGTVLTEGQFIRIDWPDGSAIQGYTVTSDSGTVMMLRYGPEGADHGRVLTIGANGKPTVLVQKGSVQVVADH